MVNLFLFEKKDRLKAKRRPSHRGKVNLTEGCEKVSGRGKSSLWVYTKM